MAPAGDGAGTASPKVELRGVNLRYFGLEGDDNLFFKTSNGVRLTIVGNFITTLQLDVDYDASPSPGRDTTDRTVALTFGYRF